MIDSTLFLLILGTLTALYTVFGLIASRHVTTQTDYFLAGRNLSIPTITGTLLATQIGGGMFLGTAQAPFEGLLYALGIVLGFLGLGLGIAARLRKFNVSIVSEIFELSYKSSTLFYITSVLSVLSLAGIVVGQIIAAKSIFVHFVGIESDWVFLSFWALIILYTMIGGLHAVIVADKVQIIFIITIFTGICIYSLWTRPVAFFTHDTLNSVKFLWDSSAITVDKVLSLVVVPFLFSFIEQDLAQRFFSASTQRVAAIAALLASILLLLFAFIPFYFGLEAQLSFADHIAVANPLIPVLKASTSPLFFVFGICAILAAITSTADSLICAISSILSMTLQRTHKAITLNTSRMITLGTGIVTLIASYCVPQHILGILVGSYEVSVSCLLVPLLGAFFLPDLRKKAALYSCFVGFASFVYFKLPYENLWYTKWNLLVTLGLSAVAYLIGHMLDTKAPQTGHEPAH